MARHSSQTAGLSLRVRTDADRASLADVWMASWREAMPDIDFAARRPWFLDHLRALEAEGAITICAFDGLNRLLGFVTFDPAKAYLDQLAVAPETKGTGAAKLLLNEARRLSDTVGGDYAEPQYGLPPETVFGAASQYGKASCTPST